MEPYPDKAYLNKSGNSLSQEFEQHFKDHCYKCGHISHRGEDCRIYKSDTAILSLCEVCRQGLHNECKSKRPDLVKKVAKLSTPRDGLTDGYMYHNMFPMWHPCMGNPFGPRQGFSNSASAMPTLPSITEN